MKTNKNLITNLHESREWMIKSIAKTSLYKTYKALVPDIDHSMDKLACSFPNVIVQCIEREVENQS